MSLKIEREVKLEHEPSVLAWDNKLFVGVEDGSIKVSDFHGTRIRGLEMVWLDVPPNRHLQGSGGPSLGERK